MKTLVATLALAALFAPPAAAGGLSKHHEQLTLDYPLGGSLKIIQDPDAMIEDGRLMGRDPDPNIRLQIRRDCCDAY